jgi:hypothetical protein
MFAACRKKKAFFRHLSEQFSCQGTFFLNGFWQTGQGIG